MSTKEIVLVDETGKKIKMKPYLGGFLITLPSAGGGKTSAFITRAHAHLLLLFLREHLDA